MAARQSDLSTLRALEKSEQRNAELMQVNSQWDSDYKNLDGAFTQYRYDSKKEHTVKQATIDKLTQEIASLREELSKSHKKIHSLQKSGDCTQRIRELEDEVALLRQQLKTYQEDFEAERRDRERLGDEKQSAALRYEADITSLKLQLDRCRNELARYTTEASRLAQQLKLKQQFEDEQYRRHLDSRGYVSRSPNGKLPPLDPYVEIDEEARRRQNGHVMKNGYNVSQSAVPNTAASTTTSRAPPLQYSSSGVPVREPRRTPSGLLARGEIPRPLPPQAVMTSSSSSSQPINRGSLTPSPVNILPPNTNGYAPIVKSAKLSVHQNGYPQQNGLLTASQPNPTGHANYPYPTPGQDSGELNSFVEVVDTDRLDTDGSAPVKSSAAAAGKGRFKCQRCALRFPTDNELAIHKSRCIG